MADPCAPGPGFPPADGPGGESEAIRQAGAWLQLFARTLKTWRLYDEHNPTVEQFRQQLAASLRAWLEAHGPLTLRFTPETVTCAGTVLHQARSRDDQLSSVFFRDGIQSLTFAPGMERDELDVFLASVIRMSGRARDDGEDLVTLLWDAELVHLDMQYVSAEADVELESESPGTDAARRSGPPMSWPRTSDPAAPGAPAAVSGALATTAAANEPGGTAMATTRSEDWTTNELSGPMHLEFEQVEADAPSALARFREERALEQRTSPGFAMLALLQDAIRAGLDAHECEALAPTIALLLEDSLARGDWAEARRALPVLRSCRSAEAEDEHWAKLARPDSVLTRSAIRHLDANSQHEVALFLELAHVVGPPGLDWLILIMAESQQQRVRRPLARTIAEVVGGDFTRLTRWLGDSRWYVVRNLVTVLHAIGGDRILPELERVVSHPDRRVRLEVIASLGTASPHSARALLLRMIDTDDARELSGALRLLAIGPDPEVSKRLLDRFLADGFHLRPVEEQRAVLSSLAVAGDDEIIPLLESRLDPGKRPPPEAETLVLGTARCLARMGSPAAHAALQRAMGSHWSSTREAASLALAAMKPR